MLYYSNMFMFSRLRRSKGSRFTLGCWGGGSVCHTFARLSATGRCRPREVAMAVPMQSFAKAVVFVGFKFHIAIRSFVSPGRRGPLCHSNRGLMVETECCYIISLTVRNCE